jgi:DNA polymerase III subunit beta
MKLSGTAEDFLHGLTPALPFVQRKVTMDCLRYAMLTAEEDRVTIQATDLRMGYTGPLPLTADTPGCLLVPAHQLSALLKAMAPDTSVTLSPTPAGKLRVVTDTGRFLLPGLEADYFPAMPALDPDAPVCLLPPRALATVLAAVTYAASDTDLRQSLHSIELLCQDGHLGATATDGHRLAHMTVPMPATPACTVLLPKPASLVLHRWLGAYDDTTMAQIWVTPTFLRCTVTDTTMTCLLEQAHFPDWIPLVPTEPCGTVVVSRLSLEQALKRAMLLRQGYLPTVRLSLTAHEMLLETIADEEVIGAETLPAAGTSAGCHARIQTSYLVEALDAMPEGDTCFLAFHDANKPLLVRTADDADDMALIMVMRDGLGPPAPMRDVDELEAVGAGV